MYVVKANVFFMRSNICTESEYESEKLNTDVMVKNLLLHFKTVLCSIKSESSGKIRS